MSIRVASISSVQKSWISFSIALTIVSKSISSIGSIGSNSLGGGIKSLGKGIKTGAGGKRNPGISVSSMSIRVASMSSVQKSWVSFSIVLTIVSKTMASIGSIGSNSLGGGIKSLSEGVKTGAGGEWNPGSISVSSMSIRVASISSVEKSWISFSIALTI